MVVWSDKAAAASPAVARVSRWLLLGAIMLVSTACYPGSYPLDIFPELHYQPSQRRLEAQRFSPPQGAVPVTGGSAEYTFEQAETLTNPVPRTPASSTQAQQLFQTNCAACHGQDGHGQGPIARYFVQARQEPPADFTSARVRSRTDGQLYWLITHGIGNMPNFASILSDDERWAMVNVVRAAQGQGQ